MTTTNPADRGICLVLVDYDNAFPPRRDLVDEEIGHDVENWLKRLCERFPSVDGFELRMYGGWYDDADLSRHGSDAIRAMSTMPSFPMTVGGSRILRGEISLAVAPIGSPTSSPLLGTYRRRRAVPRLRLAQQPYPDDCAKIDEHCPAAILRSFTRSAARTCPAESCSQVSKDAFVHHEQKMVDTMLATDILSAGQPQSGYAAVVVVSGDSDFVPPLLAASLSSSATLVQLLPHRDEASAYASEVLTDAGIEIMEVKT